MSDLTFETMLADHNQAFKDAQEFSDWMPPDGEYIATVMKCDRGVFDVTQGWWKLGLRLETPEDGTLNGKEFSGGFFSTKYPAILKSAARVLNKGEPVTSLPQANAVLTAAVGSVLRVKIVTGTGKDNLEHTNCRIQEALNLNPQPALSQAISVGTTEMEDVPF